MKRLKL